MRADAENYERFTFIHDAKGNHAMHFYTPDEPGNSNQILLLHS